MVAWGALLDRKYAVAEQNANTAAAQAQADIANTQERTRLLGPTSQAAIGLQGAQTRNLTAQSVGAENLNMVPTNEIVRGLLGSGFGVSTSLAPIEAGLTRPLGSSSRMGFAKGTARVPGKGSPKKDTVPAMLAPGEAVLNQPAAEGLGRGLIALLNAAGLQKMGMVEGDPPVQRFAGGTAYVTKPGQDQDSYEAQLGRDAAAFKRRVLNPAGEGEYPGDEAGDKSKIVPSNYYPERRPR